MPFVLMHHVASLNAEHYVSRHSSLERANQYINLYAPTLPKGDYLYIKLNTEKPNALS